MPLGAADQDARDLAVDQQHAVAVALAGLVVSGSMKGESSITTSLGIGSGSRTTSNRPAPDDVKTTTPRVPLASNSLSK